MPYPKKKNLTLDMDYNVRVLPKEKSRYKPPKWTGSELIDKYRYDRDMVLLADLFTDEETKERIRKLWNIK